eukprot:TRINITY_DN13066_c0_g1_i1.p1 TRINITY_DN13066_c0_g1~~TRINITY_DN13066_c0_g1_i1.p1  ORF type:complete len:1082 (-),score=215.03 TRINITY_DN13066_c0_g1_i1:68-3313(-)
MAELVTRETSGMSNFGISAAALFALMVGIFFNAELDLSTAKNTDGSSIYNYYVGVALMMFVGFGYLMTFLKAYGLGAVGITMYITCFGVIFAMLVESYMGKGTLSINFLSLLNGNFAVAAVLISFGGLIGKVNPMQVTVLVVVELFCYCFNKVFLLQQYAESPFILDCGGTIIIHVFGAYFGLAAASVLGLPRDDALNASSYTSDIFSLVGTVFLWLFWPSFVAGALPSGAGQTTALINTVLALLASTVVTFSLTPLLTNGKLDTVPIQNATLAGGVSIGATANLVGPFGALVIGGVAGLISTVGFCKSPFFGDVDTCGIHNLHGMPGVFGGLVSVAVPAIYQGTGASWIFQMNGLIITLFTATITGAITGKLLLEFADNSEPFNDAAHWACADDGPSLSQESPKLPAKEVADLKTKCAEMAAGSWSTSKFGSIAVVLLAVLIGCFLSAELDLSAAKATDKSSIYNYYVGVALMMFVGFGYLMTFLKAYGLGAVGLTMYITCLGVLFAIFVESYMGKGSLSIDFLSLLNGNFAVAAVLISFGGLIGKINPLQITVLVVVELFCYCFNKVYLLQQYADSPFILDCGGTIIIHVFGAYFGLAACWVMGKPKDDALNESSYTSDIFSLVGTVFLWLFWPSFVAGALPAGNGQTTALINTVLALLASTVVTFSLTPILEGGKLTTVPVQNATLAGGVSIGATANLVGPFGALVVGGLAGLLSTVGFCKSPFFGDVDTCGIHNLHGMPGIFGGLVSVIVPTIYHGTGANAAFQLNGLIITLFAAVLTGCATGHLLLKFEEDSMKPFSDGEIWGCADEGEHRRADAAVEAGHSVSSMPVASEPFLFGGDVSGLAGNLENVEAKLSAQVSRVEARIMNLEKTMADKDSSAATRSDRLEKQVKRIEERIGEVSAASGGPQILALLDRIEAAVSSGAVSAGGVGARSGPEPLLSEIFAQLKRLEAGSVSDTQVQAQLTRIETKLAAISMRLPGTGTVTPSVGSVGMEFSSGATVPGLRSPGATAARLVSPVSSPNPRSRQVTPGPSVVVTKPLPAATLPAQGLFQDDVALTATRSDRAAASAAWNGPQPS